MTDHRDNPWAHLNSDDPAEPFGSELDGDDPLELRMSAASGFVSQTEIESLLRKADARCPKKQAKAKAAETHADPLARRLMGQIERLTARLEDVAHERDLLRWHQRNWIDAELRIRAKYQSLLDAHRALAADYADLDLERFEERTPGTRPLDSRRATTSRAC